MNEKILLKKTEGLSKTNPTGPSPETKMKKQLSGKKSQGSKLNTPNLREVEPSPRQPQGRNKKGK